MSHSGDKVSAISVLQPKAKTQATGAVYMLTLGKACNPTLLSIPQTGRATPHLPQQELDSLTNTSWNMEEETGTAEKDPERSCIYSNNYIRADSATQHGDLTAGLAAVSASFEQEDSMNMGPSASA